jgi:hypothetical protein
VKKISNQLDICRLLAIGGGDCKMRGSVILRLTFVDYRFKSINNDLLRRCDRLLHYQAERK